MSTDTNQIYEVGFLLIPTIAEEVLGEKVSKIKDVILKAEGVVISEDFPKLRPLAYKISKKRDEARKDVFDKAYFGWVKFEISSESVSKLENIFRLDKEMIRFILIKTVRENTMISGAGKTSFLHKEEEQPAKTKEEEKEIDESIDELVIE